MSSCLRHRGVDRSQVSQQTAERRRCGGLCLVRGRLIPLFGSSYRAV